MSQKELEINAHQVGGSHYKTGYQVWDFIIDHDVPYMHGNILKYIIRWRKKRLFNKHRDLEKALHYCEKLISEGRPLFTGISDNEIDKFAYFNKLHGRETAIVYDLFKTDCLSQDTRLKNIRYVLNSMIDDYKNKTPFHNIMDYLFK